VPPDCLTGDIDLIADGEVRTPATAPSMGAVIKRKDWGEVIRRTYRRHLVDARTPQRMLLIDFEDLHGTTFIRAAMPTDNDRRYVLEGYTSPQPDRRFSASFALPRVRENQTAVISMTAALAGAPVDLAWKSGKVSLTVARKDVYTSPWCVIPHDVLRSIDAAGGVFRITLTPVEGTVNHEYGVRVAVQEKTS